MRYNPPAKKQTRLGIIPRLLATALLVLSITILAIATNHPQAKVALAAGSNPCNLTSSPTQVKHVIWIWEENHAESQVIGNSSAPYFNQLAKQCGYSTNLLDNIAPTYPSEPQYAIGTSGSNCVTGIGTSGTGCITNDNDFGTSNSLKTVSIFQQLGTNWKSYQETMPGNCARSSSGNYVYKHNPAAFYTNIYTTCQSNDVPLPSLSCSSSATNQTCSGTLTATGNSLVKDLTNNTLPAFSFITPNMVNDWHSGSIQQMDNWLYTYITKIIQSKAYATDHNTVIMVMADESDTNGGTVKSIPNLVIAPSVNFGGAANGIQYSGTVNNVGYLHTVQRLLGLSYLGCATGTQPGTSKACPSGSTTDVSAAFNLTPGTSTPPPPPPPTPTPTPHPAPTPTPVARQNTSSSNTSSSAGSTGTSTSNQPGCTSLPTTTFGQGTQNFSVPSDGTYKIWSRIKATDSIHNSYFLQIDNGCPIVVGDNGSMSIGTWQWVDYKDSTISQTIDVNLSQGTHKLTFTGREAGVQLDRILILSDKSCLPSGTGDNCAGTSVSSAGQSTSTGAGGVNSTDSKNSSKKSTNVWLFILPLLLVVLYIWAFIRKRQIVNKQFVTQNQTLTMPNPPTSLTDPNIQDTAPDTRNSQWPPTAGPNPPSQ